MRLFFVVRDCQKTLEKSTFLASIDSRKQTYFLFESCCDHHIPEAFEIKGFRVFFLPVFETVFNAKNGFRPKRHTLG